MYGIEKIGVGIVTYSRAESFYKLFRQIANIPYIDNIVIVKNSDVNYGLYDPEHIINDKVQYFHIPDKPYVAASKNRAMQALLDNRCEHIFIFEDDIEIINTQIFKKYIDTAKAFKIGHLNFCANNLPTPEIIQKPIYRLMFNQSIGLDFYRNLCGMMSYFTRETLLEVGLMDEENYKNALEHVQHTYRICLKNLYIPKFHMFADIVNSTYYLKDTGTVSSINSKSNQYFQNLHKAFKTFENTYKVAINKLLPPSIYELNNFYKIKQLQN